MPAFLDLRLFVIKPLESAAVSRSAHPENFTFAIMLSGKSTSPQSQQSTISFLLISYDHEPLRCCTSRYRYYNSTSFFWPTKGIPLTGGSRMKLVRRVKSARASAPTNYVVGSLFDQPKLFITIQSLSCDKQKMWRLTISKMFLHGL